MVVYWWRSLARDLRDERLDSAVTSVCTATFLRFLTERQRRLVRRGKLMMNNALNPPPGPPLRYRLLASHND